MAIITFIRGSGAQLPIEKLPIEIGTEICADACHFNAYSNNEHGSEMQVQFTPGTGCIIVAAYYMETSIWGGTYPHDYQTNPRLAFTGSTNPGEIQSIDNIKQEMQGIIDQDLKSNGGKNQAELTWALDYFTQAYDAHPPDKSVGVHFFVEVAASAVCEGMIVAGRCVGEWRTSNIQGKFRFKYVKLFAPKEVESIVHFLINAVLQGETITHKIDVN